jgi:hypothetical protein
MRRSMTGGPARIRRIRTIDAWPEEVLENSDGIEAKTLFDVLQREHPGKYQDGQLRAFHR